MTWSSSHPRGVRRSDGAASPAPVSWAPEELALDTSGLHAAVSHAREQAPPPPVEPSGLDALEVAHALEDAFARGYEEGRQAGELAEGARLRSAVLAASDALGALQRESERWLGNAEANIAALAIAVARHVIGQQIAEDKSSMGEMVRGALAEFPIDQPLVVRVNPSDLRAITVALSEGGETPVAQRAELQWMSDARIAPGGCLVEGRDRIVDGRVDTALERVYRRLTYTGA